MVSPNIIELVKQYLRLLSEEGITITKAFLYGSHAQGAATEESDIDIMLVSPLFDKDTDKYAPLLWKTASKVSYQIEPIAVSEKKFYTDEYSHLIAIVHQ